MCCARGCTRSARYLRDVREDQTDPRERFAASLVRDEAIQQATDVEALQRIIDLQQPGAALGAARQVGEHHARQLDQEVLLVLSIKRL